MADLLNLKAISQLKKVHQLAESVGYLLGPICMICFVSAWLSLARRLRYLNFIVAVAAVATHIAAVRFCMFIRECCTSPW
jgi:EamA domain-containing membrane protein RarD